MAEKNLRGKKMAAKFGGAKLREKKCQEEQHDIKNYKCNKCELDRTNSFLSFLEVKMRQDIRLVAFEVFALKLDLLRIVLYPKFESRWELVQQHYNNNKFTLDTL